MSEPCWNVRMRQILHPEQRLAVLGVGQVFRHDDGVGVYIARQLAARLPQAANRLILDVGSAPENFSGLLRRFKPETVLLIDAVHLGLAPGAVQLVDCRAITDYGFATHSLLPSLLIRFLDHELHCAISLLGIQPAQIDDLVGLSGPVKLSQQLIVNELVDWLQTPPDRSAKHL
jgi:hydrogenase 3 maturation protease